MGEDDFAILSDHGFDEEDQWDIAALSGFVDMSNRLANMTSMRPNEEFYTIGRY
jgi:alkylhydroperoxidase family enzyme